MIVLLIVVVALLVGLAAFFIVHALEPSSSAGPAPGADSGALTASQVTRYQQDVARLDKANQVASWEFTAAGSQPSGKELDRAASPYQAALDRHETDIHLIGWPAHSQNALQVDTTQLQALVAFLESSNGVTPAAAAAWLAQLQGHTKSFEEADNALRKSVGVPGSSISD
jgi:hypothetical protein